MLKKYFNHHNTSKKISGTQWSRVQKNTNYLFYSSLFIITVLLERHWEMINLNYALLGNTKDDSLLDRSGKSQFVLMG